MNELDQLRADLATLKAAMAIYERDYKGTDGRAVIGVVEAKIRKLEAKQADPWRGAKEFANFYRDKDSTSNLGKLIVHYDHLTAENERLAKENAALGSRLDGLTEDFRERDAELNEAIKRAAAQAAELEREQVWGIHSQVDGHLIEAFVTKEEAEANNPSRGAEPTFREVRVAKAEDIVKALREAQKHENKYRVERDEATKRVAELEASLPRGFREHDDHGK